MSDHDRFAAQARAFQAIHERRPVSSLIPNLHARVERIETTAGPLPVTVHDSHAGDAWVCSPRSTYADCAAEEAARYLPRALSPLAASLSPLGGLLCEATRLDQAVTVNNWLLSTNLYPSVAGIDISAIIHEAVQRWPRHAVWFRSLNAQDNTDWLHALQRAGCQLVVSRQVWLYDDLAQGTRRHADLKRDLGLLARTPLAYCDDTGITEADYARIAELYALLYTAKYSRFNPMYGADFLARWHRADLLEFHGFRADDGVLQTVVGLFRQGCVATSPIVGYDTAQPRAHGLYRLATASAYRRSLQQGWRLNFSAGAAGFKRLRGGRPAIEYSAVYTRHLPRRTRAAVAALSLLTRRLGAPLLNHFQL
ncbi:hypothetical protein [Stenotrophomonas panacihumi]|uniref:hypothetical protein n=1 Tax=Stenotrophomonas panacihumi TaxID=676599 RepID=UPI000A7648BB|nr:hypothetical protein [Stenotrophomonas panacihumi]